MYDQIGKTITMGPQSIEIHFCQVWGLDKRRLLSYEFFEINVNFQIFQLSMIFLIFSDNRIMLSGKFYIGFIYLDIILSHFLVFYMIFFKNSTKKFEENCQRFEISRKPPYSIYRAEPWQKFIFYHKKYVCKISAKPQHPTWRRLYIWREITHPISRRPAIFEFFQQRGRLQRAILHRPI